MKRLILGLLTLAALSSCVVSDPYAANRLSESNIGMYCSGVFEQDVQKNVECFYKVYYISRFLEAGAEEKVSAKYDDIRTGLRQSGVNYSFDGMSISFTKGEPFTVGGIWSIRHDYSREIMVVMRSETEWEIAAEQDDTKIHLTLLSADDSGMKLNIQVKGKWTEQSSYSADFSSESIDVEIVNKNPISIDRSYYGGIMSFDFYEDLTKIMACDMTLRAGNVPIYTIYK